MAHGYVVDEFGKKMPDVQVSVKGKNESVITDSTGHFSITASQGNTLVFQSPQYDTEESVAGTGEMTLRLNRAFLQRPDTIDVLYGQKSANTMLGSYAAIYTPQLTTTPAHQYSFALSGRLSGLYIQQTNGWPLQSKTALINPDVFLWVERMAGTEGLPGPDDNSQQLLSLRGQAPVTIIDGVQRNLYSIPAEHIESVTVLKDALSSILMGQKSSRGVLLVTSRKPVKGDPRISFTAQTASQKPLGLPKPLPSYQYAWLYNEALLNDDRAPVYSADDFNAYREGSNPLSHPDVNWYNAVLRDQAPMTSYDLSVSGGGNVARYLLSLGYLDMDGLFKQNPDAPYKTNAGVKRYTVNSNVDIDVSQYFNVGLNIFGRIEQTNQPGAGVEPIMRALATTPNNAYPVTNPNGSLGGNQVYANNIYGMATGTGYLSGNNRDAMAGIHMKYDFRKWLPGLWAKFIGNTSVSSSSVVDRSKGFPVFQMSVSEAGDTSYSRYGNPFDQRNIYSLTAFAEYWYGQLSVGYDFERENNFFSAMLFADQRQETVGFDLPSNATNLAAKGSYHHDNKYFAELAVNYAGFDRFPPGKRFGLFYAAGIGWDMAKESFMKNSRWLSRMKWKLTYGLTGNANVGYFVYDQYFTGKNLAAYFGNAWQNGRVESSPLSNPYVTWEKAHKLDIGVDVAMFGNKLQVNVDYYTNKYFDLMQVRGKANPTIGNTYGKENIGINRYSGVEIDVAYKNHFGSVNWFVAANGSLMKTKVLYMDEVHRDYSWNRRTGQPVGQLFGYIADGLYRDQKEVDNGAHFVGVTPSPGDIRYKDLNNDGEISDFDMAPIGNTRPLMYYGLSTGFSVKGFDVNVLFQGVHNRDLLLTGAGMWPFYATVNGQAWEHNVDRWTPQTAGTATMPRLTSGVSQNNHFAYSSFWVRSGNYIRLKNAEVGYTLPYHWVNPLRLGGVRLFANGLNLFTHSPNKDVDPEVSVFNSPSVYPIQRVINVGLTVKF